MDESRIVTRSIELTWGGEQRVLPVLPMKPADEWRRFATEKFADEEIDQDLDAATALQRSGEHVIDLLLAYDKTGVLSSREWIEEHVTEDELADAFLEVWRRSFRLGRLAMELQMAALGRPQPARSPNGRSLTGTSTPIS